jgi:hypothetical protein
MILRSKVIRWFGKVSEAVKAFFIVYRGEGVVVVFSQWKVIREAPLYVEGAEIMIGNRVYKKSSIEEGKAFWRANKGSKLRCDGRDYGVSK